MSQGTAIPDLPEMKRVKENQKHISSVVEAPQGLLESGSDPINAPSILYFLICNLYNPITDAKQLKHMKCNA